MNNKIILSESAKVHVSQVDTDLLIDEYLVTRSQLAMDELVKRYIPHASKNGLKYSRAFCGYGCEDDDFIAWSMEAVWEAIKTLDRSKVNSKYSLSANLLRRVTQRLHQHVIDSYRRALGHRSSRRLAMDHNEYLDSYYKAHGYYPTFEEIEEELRRRDDLRVKRSTTGETRGGCLYAKPTSQNIRNAVLVNTPAKSAMESDAFYEMEADDHIDGKELAESLLNQNVYNLKESERWILASLMQGTVDRQIGKAIGVCRSSIGSTRKKLLQRLRQKEKCNLD